MVEKDVYQIFQENTPLIFHRAFVNSIVYSRIAVHAVKFGF